jgi:acyl-[acyl-carrier-protein] desaturase
MTPIALLHELEPRVGELLDRHLANAKEWFPHEYVPYSRGRDFEKGYEWSEEDIDTGGTCLPDAVRSALYVNLLTEDNLPYYFRQIETLFGADGAYGTWSRRWTAEEGRHSIVIRDYLTATRAIDPVELERGRMAQVSLGEVPEPDSPLVGMVYVALQELATRIAHRNTGKLIGDKAGFDVMARVALDENLHHLFYRDLVSGALEIDPSAMVIAMEEVVRTFAMPGTGIPGFDKHSALIAQAGIYDVASFHEQVLVGVVLKQWRLADLTGLSPEAEEARQSTMTRIDRVGRLAAKLAARRDRELAASAS